eukprot:TRINITY_DN44003_c0_g1_i1.p1 TRINITY_DN44003_c0_g1~~TRINITY_DN44003_c0_g1_i1.p1  ORF type:complete len:247 (+),score=58.76 TRINITY_DN44003_c0_g1_i1:63-803(+)
MPAQAVVRLRADRTAAAVCRWSEERWLETPAVGVMRRLIERDGGERARATTVVRFEPNSSFPAHLHGGGEEFFVLDGVWRDHWGAFPKYSYVRNYIGSRHSPHIGPEGCTILVKLRQMHESLLEPEHTSWDASPGSSGWEEVSPGREVKVLHANRHESVSVERWAPGSYASVEIPRGGEELYVVDGTLTDEVAGDLRHGDWARHGDAARRARTAGAKGCYLWRKTGHTRSPEVGMGPDPQIARAKL